MFKANKFTNHFQSTYKSTLELRVKIKKQKQINITNIVCSLLMQETDLINKNEYVKKEFNFHATTIFKRCCNRRKQKRKINTNHHSAALCDLKTNFNICNFI